MLAFSVVDKVVEAVDCCPWSAMVGRSAVHQRRMLQVQRQRKPQSLYTPEERVRRDASPWTIVQGVLAPLQFLVFLVSLGFVLYYLATGEGFYAATISVVVKTLVLYTIMVTGSIWEHEVFGKYLFARSFFWEDVVSILVLALHTAYLVALFTGVEPERQMVIALAAYAAYVINAAQFVLKLRAARRETAGSAGRLESNNAGPGGLGVAQ